MAAYLRIHQNDLPNLSNYQGIESIAVDTETLGLNLNRDRLCLVQISPGDGTADLIQISSEQTEAPNLKQLLLNKDLLKIFHFGRFDLAILEKKFGTPMSSVYCTKIASKLVRTYTERHGLKELCSELLGVQIQKQQQCSDWGASNLSSSQLEYAASDVLYLHRLKEVLDSRLIREGRFEIAQACFDFLPMRAHLDLLGWSCQDIFAHI